MKKILPGLLLILSPLILMAAEDQPEFTYWSGADLDAFSTMLSAQAGESHSAVADRIIDYGHYFAAMVYREEGSSLFELHEEWADLYVVTSGQGLLIAGGSLSDPEVVAPGEIRGSGIVNGRQQVISEGDIVHIPANTPHYVQIEPGHELTYFIFKIEDVL